MSERPKREDEYAPAGASFTATEAQNNFGHVLDEANRRGVVYILKYGKPAAVVESIEHFRASGGQPTPSLAELAAEYDGMVERMQAAMASGAVERFFSMSPEEIGRAAHEGALRRAAEAPAPAVRRKARRKTA